MQQSKAKEDNEEDDGREGSSLDASIATWVLQGVTGILAAECMH